MGSLLQLLEPGHFEFSPQFHATRAVRCRLYFQDLNQFDEECITLAKKIPNEVWEHNTILAAGTYCGHMAAYDIGRWLEERIRNAQRRLVPFLVEASEGGWNVAQVASGELHGDDKAVVIFENLLTGQRAGSLCRWLRDAGVEVTHVLALVDRRTDRKPTIDGAQVVTQYVLAEEGYNGPPDGCPACKDKIPVSPWRRLL